MMTSDGWKLVPVEPTRKMLDEGGFYFIQGGGSVSDSDMAQAKRVYRAMLTAAPAAPQAAGWTDRHTSVTRFALWRFINDAYAQANYAAQRISREPVENVAKFQDDARTAEEARAMLAAAPVPPQREAQGCVVESYSSRMCERGTCGCVVTHGIGGGGEQAEPKRKLTAGERDVLDSALRSSTRLVSRGVAEPKREPLSEAQCAELSEWMWQEIGISLSNATLRRLEKKLNSIGDSDER